MNAFWLDFIQRTRIGNMNFLFSLVRRTDMRFALVRFDTFWFYLVHIADMQIRSLLRTHIRVIYILRVIRLRSYRGNMRIESHYTLSKLSF